MRLAELGRRVSAFGRSETFASDCFRAIKRLSESLRRSTLNRPAELQLEEVQ
jgi:hypothetical protein